MEIRELRQQRGWSQEELAEASGLSVRTIQRVENGESPSAETLKSLAAVFELPLADLKRLNEESPQQVLTADERAVLREIQAIRGFHVHFFIYVAVSILLFVINLASSTAYIWAFWPALGWGIGVAAHACAVYKPLELFGADWERREFEKRLARRRQR